MNKKQLQKADLVQLTQSARFIDAARKAGCSEDESVFDDNLKKIARRKAMVEPSPKPSKKPRSK